MNSVNYISVNLKIWTYVEEKKNKTHINERENAYKCLSSIY